MSWSSRRQTRIIGVILVLVIVACIPFVWKLLQSEPTCFDGQRNQDEVGIDCGGSCQYLCLSQVAPLQILWSRSFSTTPGSYNAVAYIENPNQRAAIETIPYVFRLYDSNNVLVTERFGETFVSTQGITPIFEPKIETGSRVVTRTTFEFLQPSPWQEITSPKELEVVSQRLSSGNRAPRVDAEVTNDGFEPLQNVVIVGIVFNAQGNAIGASQTVIPVLPARTTSPVFFVWPQPFNEPIAKIEVIPRIPPGEQQ